MSDWARFSTMWQRMGRTQAWRVAAEMLFPRFCHCCDTALEDSDDALCANCATLMAGEVGGDYCGLCGRDVGAFLLKKERCPACVNKLPRLERVYRVARYEGVTRRLVLRFKYGGGATLDALLGDWMADVAGTWSFANEIDCWSCVPSPLRRSWYRGYQPTRLLADRVAKRLGQARRDLLKLTRPIEQQKALPESARADNVRGAFAVRPGVDVTGMTIGLVDDVMTTGETLRVCARALHEAGARRVVAVVVAAAQPGQDAIGAASQPSA